MAAWSAWGFSADFELQEGECGTLQVFLRAAWDATRIDLDLTITEVVPAMRLVEPSAEQAARLSRVGLF